MILQFKVVRLWLLLLVASILPYLVVAYGSWPMISRQAANKGEAYRASWSMVGRADGLGISSLKNCTERYDINKYPLSKRRQASVFLACDTKSNNSLVIIKAFISREAFNLEAMSFDVLAKGKRIYEAGRSEASAPTANAETSPWNHFVQLLGRCHHEGRPALVIEFLDRVLTDAIKLEPIKPPQTGYDASEGLATTSSAGDISLRQSLSENSASQFKLYAFQLVRAVEVLHQVGIAHLDIKPDNIGLASDGTLKLFDFQTVCTTNPKMFAGTIEYSAPEMNLVLPNAHRDKMDIWSVGCTIFEIFTGEELFPVIRAFAKTSMWSTVVPKLNCYFMAAYFYIIWFFGITKYDKYRAFELRIKEFCPQIFAVKSKHFLQLIRPRVFATAYPHLWHREKLTEFDHTFYRYFCDESTIVTRIEPSGVVAYELVTLLKGMLELDDDIRISAHSALTKYNIFEEYDHSNTANN